MDGRDRSVNKDSLIDCDNLDLWHLSYSEQLVLENPLSIASSAIRPTGSIHLVRSGIPPLAG